MRGQAIYIYSGFGKTGTKFIFDNSFASIPLGIYASNEEILKQVQNDVNSLPSGLLFF